MKDTKKLREMENITSKLGILNGDDIIYNEIKTLALK
jgi:hypothetical protein